MTDQGRPELDAAEYWRRLSPQERAGAVAAMTRVYAEDGERFFQPEVAVVDGPLPDAALAMVIRDPVSPGTPTFVFSSSTFTMRAFVAARTALDHDVRRIPESAARRTVRVSADAASVSAQDGWRYPPPPLAKELTGEAADLLGQLNAAASTVRRTHLDGIGAATLFSF